MARVGLVFGGRSVEHRVSVKSARTVAVGLEAAGRHQVIPIGIALDGCWASRAASTEALAGDRDFLEPAGTPVAESLSAFPALEIDVAFPIVHGTWGEDGTLQGFFEMLDLPYVGADVAASAVAMDKVLCKRVLQTAGIPVVDYTVVQANEFANRRADVVERLSSVDLPVFVKPSVGGSSVGIRRVTVREELVEAVEFALRFDDTVLVEVEISGRELECAVLGYPEVEASRMGEIVPGAEFYDYADKYLDDNAGLLIPAELDPTLEAELREVAVQAFAAIGGTGMARVDFLMNGETAYVNEINSLPGFTSISMYPKLWEATGVPLAELTDRLIGHAVARHEDRRRLDAGIKAWVAELDGR